MKINSKELKIKLQTLLGKVNKEPKHDILTL